MILCRNESYHSDLEMKDGEEVEKWRQSFQKVLSEGKQRNEAVAETKYTVKGGIFCFFKGSTRPCLCKWQLSNIKGKNLSCGQDQGWFYGCVASVVTQDLVLRALSLECSAVAILKPILVLSFHLYFVIPNGTMGHMWVGGYL